MSARRTLFFFARSQSYKETKKIGTLHTQSLWHIFPQRMLIAQSVVPYRGGMRGQVGGRGMTNVVVDHKRIDKHAWETMQ